MGGKPSSRQVALQISDLLNLDEKEVCASVPCLLHLWQYFLFIIINDTQIFHKQSRSLDPVWINVSSV